MQICESVTASHVLAFFSPINIPRISSKCRLLDIVTSTPPSDPNHLLAIPTMFCKPLLFRSHLVVPIGKLLRPLRSSFELTLRRRSVQSTLTMASSLHRNPPFRAEHLGSLLRPDDLLKTRADLDNGKAQQEELTSIEDTSVKDIVETQIKLGFHPISDGEYRRHSTSPARAIRLVSLPNQYCSVLGYLLPRPRRLPGDQEP